ncbi:MAG: VOC family protein [Alphaproteobacteria bacterium TMED89]|nr:glyoxalase [Rhodospirillaceae bacterium]RPH19534.1 MAG: VOC family protein [Alphaproteobacteria bacterium TMED89]
MIGYLMVGTNDLARSLSFYDAVFAPLGYQKVKTKERYVAYGNPETGGRSEFYVTGPFDKKPATAGNGTMVALPVPTLQILHDIYEIAGNSGGLQDGAPGPRVANSPTHYAYVRDPEGNKLAFYCDDPTA